MTDRTAALVAASDQHRARVRDLVQLVRDHHDAHQCPPEVPCPGEWAWQQIMGLRCHDRAGLLSIALVELAALGYGLPPGVDDYRLTERAARLLDPPAGGAAERDRRRPGHGVDGA